ncbi:transketolase [Mycoplasmoides genitalium]
MKYLYATQHLTLNAIKHAKGGHVGMAIGASPILFSLFTRHFHFDPDQPKWINRDRFVLSAGHGSMALYSIFHFAGLISKQEILQHKHGQINTSSHPEYAPNNFIDASTGPLGQGFGMAVGMALAQKLLANEFKELSDKLFDHYTYVVVGDGDLQEGVSYEVSQIAGLYKLNKLIVLHDSNRVQMDSEVKKVANENLKVRFENVGWNYIHTDDQLENIDQAIIKAKQSDKPTFIEVRTTIAKNTHLEDQYGGYWFIPNEVDFQLFEKRTNTNFNFFNYPDSIYQWFKQTVIERQKQIKEDYNNLLISLKDKPLFKKFTNWIDSDFQALYLNQLDEKKVAKKDSATRNYLKDFLNQINNPNSNLYCLNTDVSRSCFIKIGDDNLHENPCSRNIQIGIREFAMATIMNGMALHGGIKVMGGTFLAFADYSKPAIRLGALMNLPVFYVYTHDSYQVGGDGPTHQPYDQLPMLRAIENVCVFRPCDEKETCAGFNYGLLSQDQTTVLVLTRQPLKSIDNTDSLKTLKGGYILLDRKQPDLIIAASGSEVQLAIEFEKVLTKQNVKVRILSVPNITLLLKQDEKYLKSLFDANSSLITIEASSSYEWFCFKKYVKNHAHLGAFSFGESDDGDKVYQQKGFNLERLMKIFTSLRN